MLAEKAETTKESVTNQLITKCHLSSELFSRNVRSTSFFIELPPEAPAKERRKDPSNEP
jgi:hypothetical protein